MGLFSSRSFNTYSDHHYHFGIGRKNLSMTNILRLLGLVILVVGIILLIFGVRSTEEFGQKVSQTMTGTYSGKTRGNIIGGCIAIVVGGALISCSGRFRRK
jgi:hypothetical protein